MRDFVRLSIHAHVYATLRMCACILKVAVSRIRAYMCEYTHTPILDTLYRTHMSRTHSRTYTRHCVQLDTLCVY